MQTDVRKKSASKKVSRLAKYNENDKAEEEANTILTALKFFKDQNHLKSGTVNKKSEKSTVKNKSKENEKIEKNDKK